MNDACSGAWAGGCLWHECVQRRALQALEHPGTSLRALRVSCFMLGASSPNTGARSFNT